MPGAQIGFTSVWSLAVFIGGGVLMIAVLLLFAFTAPKRNDESEVK